MNIEIPTDLAVYFFLKNRKDKRLSSDTIRWYRGILREYARTYPVLPDSAIQIDTFIANQVAGDERVHGYWRALRAFYRFLNRRYKIPNPVELTEPPKRIRKEPRPLTLDELAQLLMFPHKDKIKAALYFLADTGCRVGELVNLHPTDLSETPWGYVARVTGKTGARIVPVSADTYYALLKNLPLGYSKYRLRRLISYAFRDAKVKGTAHTLRHTFGTLWEGDELVLQRIMGHSSLATTQIYRKQRMERLQRQHQRYSPLKKVKGLSLPLELLYNDEKRPEN